MEVRLLGLLEVLDDHAQPVRFRGLRPPAVLAVLALQVNQPVTIAQLIQALWGTQPPPRARESIHYFIHQLRTTLGQGVISTHGSGYLLQLAPEQIDAIRFGQLTDQAHTAAAHGTLQLAWEQFGQALRLWRGVALVDFPEAPFVEVERARLEGRRVAAVEARLRVGLELGRHAELAGELEALTAEYPLREGLWELLMLARYRTGQQAAALAAYQTARTQLMAQGLEPEEGLRRLEGAILRHDPALDLPSQQLDRQLLSPSTLLRPAATPSPSRVTQPAHPTPKVAHARPREERKTVTVLMVEPAAGQPGDPEEVRTQAGTLTRRVDAVAGRYGGVVVTEGMGRLLVAFGARQSHEDDPERAVRAALELCADARTTGSSVRIGVATGKVIVTRTHLDDADDIAAPAVVTSLVGGVLDVAVWLAGSATPGSVVVGSRTYWATARAIAYRPALTAAEPDPLGEVHAWEALAPRARTGAFKRALGSTPLVEREREVAILADLLARLLSDQEPQLLTMVSEPGLGKSRLVAELGRLVDQASELITWRAGRSVPYGAGSLAALAEIIKAHAGILDSDPPKLTQDKLDQAVADVIEDPSEADWVTDQLQLLLGPTPVPLESGPRTRELIAGWARFLAAAAARRPMVVVVEDLHWADEVLLEFIDTLVEQAGSVPLLVVGTARLELLERHPQWGGGKRNTTTLALSPLSPEGTSQLLDALLDTGQLPGGTRQALLDAAGGNPLYVEEYIQMLTEGCNGAVSLPNLDTPPAMPETIQQVIAARLDLLPAADKHLLQDAAVLGETGWVGALAAVSGRDRDQVTQVVRRLERRELLRRVRVSSVAGETEFAFRHTLIREVAYQQLLRGERASRHRRAAEWITALNPHPGERIELLAHHYQRVLELAEASGMVDAAMVARTRTVLRAAGDHARGVGALATAERWYAAALKLWPADDAERPELLFRLGGVRAVGRQQGKNLLVEARDAFIATGNTVRAAQAAFQLAYLARNSGDAARAAAYLKESRALNSNDRAAQVVAMAGQALELAIRGNIVEAIAVGRERAHDASMLGLPEEEGYALSGVGMASLESGDLAGGKIAYQRSVELLELAQSPAVHHGRWGWARGLVLYGDLGAAAAMAAEGRKLAETPGSAGIVAAGHVTWWFDSILATVDYSAGRWDAVISYVDDALARAGDTRGYPEPWYRPLRGRVRLGRGDLSSALDDADAGRAVAEHTGELRMIQPCLALKARVLLAAGRTDEAAELLDELLDEQHRDPARATVTADQAALMVELDYPTGVLPEALWPTRWHQAARALVTRDFVKAAKVFDHIGAHTDAATARWQLARTLAAADPAAATAALNRTIIYWQTAGASAYLAEAEALAATLT